MKMSEVRENWLIVSGELLMADSHGHVVWGMEWKKQRVYIIMRDVVWVRGQILLTVGWLKSKIIINWGGLDMLREWEIVYMSEVEGAGVKGRPLVK